MPWPSRRTTLRPLTGRRFGSIFDERRIVGGTAILAVTQFAASIAGLLRDRLLNVTFPREVTDVYFASFRPSDFLFQTCILSALGTVLVPLLAGHHTHGRQKELFRLLSATVHLSSIVFGVIAVILAVFFPILAPHLVQFQGEQLALYVQFGRLALLSNFLFVFGTTFGQYLITVQRYWIYGITPILYTLGTIIGTVVFSTSFGTLGPMIGTIAGALVYAVVRGWAVLRQGRLPFGVYWDLHFRDMGMLMLPRVLSLGALQAQLLVFDALASGLPAGAITVNAAARNFQSVVVGVVGIALAQAVYSPLSQAFARADGFRYRMYLRKAISMALVLTSIGAVVLVAATPVAAMLVGLSGQLGRFAVVLAVYAFSIPFESINHILLRGSYALRNTFLPAIATVCNGGTSMLVAIVLVPSMGIAALPLGFAMGQAVQGAFLGALLPRRVRRLTVRA